MVELLAVLTLMGVLLGIAGVTVASLRTPRQAQVLEALSAARHDAIISGQPTSWQHDTVVVRFLPDGSSSGAAFEWGGLHITVDAVTGEICADE
jgi:hypothetical protein